MLKRKIKPENNAFIFNNHRSKIFNLQALVNRDNQKRGISELPAFMATNATIMVEHEGDATVPPEETMDFDEDTLRGEEK